jgi:hypothetical protein
MQQKWWVTPYEPKKEYKMRKLIAILVVLVLALSALPVTATFAAGSEGSTAGSFSVGSVAPNVTAAQIYEDAACTSVATALTPQVLYYVKVTVTDANTLNNIKNITVKYFYDVGATHPDEANTGVGNAQTAGIFTWTKTGNVWAVDAGSGSSWAVVSGSSTVPTLTASSGDWIFAIKVGKVATESIAPDVWDLHARATDNANLTSGYYLWGKAVLWYGEVQVNTANVNFGAVTLNSGFASNVNTVTGISATMISNGNYEEGLKSSATWTGSLDPLGNCVNSGQFALKGWPSNIYGSAQLLTTSGVSLHLDTITAETGDIYSTYTLWLKVAPIFPADVYSGSVTFMIVNN